MQMTDSGASSFSLSSTHTPAPAPAPKTNGTATHSKDIQSKRGAGDDEESETESLERLLTVSVILLRQAVDLVSDSLTEDAQISTVSKYIPGSTIGKHIRHATDHFTLLLDSLSSSSTSSTSNTNELELSYDIRSRGTPMETSRAAACTALESCVSRLQAAVPHARRDAPVRLRAVTPYEQTFRTSFGRELWFAALHAVHHWSMVRVIAGELGIQLEDSFGVAPSTLVHHGSDGPLGKPKI